MNIMLDITNSLGWVEDILQFYNHEGIEENHEKPIMIISVPAEIQTKYDSTELLLYQPFWCICCVGFI